MPIVTSWDNSSQSIVSFVFYYCASVLDEAHVLWGSKKCGFILKCNMALFDVICFFLSFKPI